MSSNIQAEIGLHLAQSSADALALQRIAGAMPDRASFGEARTSGGFAADMLEAVRAVNEKDRLAAGKMADVDSGRSGDLVGAMLASQEASLSFSMLMQVRNKVMGAVEELIKLPL